MAVSDTIIGAAVGGGLTMVGSIIVALIGKRQFLQHAVETYMSKLLTGYENRIRELTDTYEKRLAELTSSYEARIADLTSEIKSLRTELRSALHLDPDELAVD